MRARPRNSQGERSQSLVEFAIVAPLLFLFLFGVVDFGRVIYLYVTLNQAVNEGARTAIRASAQLPSNSDVETAVKHHAVDVSLANPCPNGPITSATPAANQGWIYITEPNPPSTVETLSPTLLDAPGGTAWAYHANNNPQCSATNPAHDHAPLQVTIRYNFVPFTPLLQQWGANITITAAATYQTEY
jgi:Flp pilus assembly protein TadG